MSRQAQERNAQKRVGLSAILAPEPLRDRLKDKEPSYSPEYLAELKSSTPSTLSRRESPSPGRGIGQDLDVAAKFGKDLSRYADRDRNSAIPTEAEIQEKKARRARLAKEQKYKAQGSDLSDGNDDEDMPDAGRDSDDDEFMNQRDVISLSNEPKGPETRLTHDDEDLMEDFDSFVDDGRINLGRKAEKEQQRKQREEMRDLINDAEGLASDDSDDSDMQRRHEYEAVQTRKGMEGLRVEDGREAEDSGAKTPPKIAPLPSLSSCVERLRTRLQEVEASRKNTVSRLEEIERKRQEIPAQEQYIQEQLKVAGAQYARLRAEAGLNGANGTTASDPSYAMDQPYLQPATAISNGPS